MTEADLFLGIFEAIPGTPWNALKISRGFLRAENHLSRCLLFPDWMHTLVSSNQHGVLTAWLWKSFQNATNASSSRSNGERTAYERLSFRNIFVWELTISQILHVYSLILIFFIFNTSRAPPKEKADFANIEHTWSCARIKILIYVNFLSTILIEKHWNRWKSASRCLFVSKVCFYGHCYMVPPLHWCQPSWTCYWLLRRKNGELNVSSSTRLACHSAQLKNACCLTHQRAISPGMELDTLHCAMRHATFVFTVR